MQRFILFLIAFFLLPGALASQAPDTSAGGPQRVQTGIYLMNVYDLDINAYSFYADFYLWFRWKGELDPTNIEFVNLLEKWGFTQDPFYPDQPFIQLPDGTNYYGTRVEGRFYHSFVLNRFPLDKHSLDIRLEHKDFTKDSLIYVPDTVTSLFRPDFNIPGWIIRSAHIETNPNKYRTNFGEPVGKASMDFSNFTLMLTIARPISYFLLKLMLPLVVVILASLGALFIHPRYLDARISLPIGGLLSCVFLQQSYSSALPDVGYMVLMDRIYLLSYLLIAAIMLRVIVTGNKLAHSDQEDALRLKRHDRRRSLVLFGLFMIGTVIMVLITR